MVPIGDAQLFQEFDFALNLGGIANISMDSNGVRLAFDTCPFNLLLNHFSLKLGKPFDEDGEFAKSGVVIPEILKTLEELPFYQQSGAKSLGRENITEDYLPVWITLIILRKTYWQPYVSILRIVLQGRY